MKSGQEQIQVHFINLIHMIFFISHYIPPSVFQLQLQSNQSQEALQRALEYPHTLLWLSDILVMK